MIDFEGPFQSGIAVRRDGTILASVSIQRIPPMTNGDFFLRHIPEGECAYVFRDGDDDYVCFLADGRRLPGYYADASGERDIVEFYLIDHQAPEWLTKQRELVERGLRFEN